MNNPKIRDVKTRKYLEYIKNKKEIERLEKKLYKLQYSETWNKDIEIEMDKTIKKLEKLNKKI